MTRITVLGYTIAADASSWTLYEHRKRGDEAKEAGKSYEVAIGFYSRLPQVLDALLDRYLKDCDARSLRELADALATAKAEIADVFQHAIQEAGDA